MAALRSKSPTATNRSYTSHKLMGSVIDRTDRTYTSNFGGAAAQENQPSRPILSETLTARNHAAH